MSASPCWTSVGVVTTGLELPPPNPLGAREAFIVAQAGVPFTSGFLAKFYVISAAVEAESYAIAIIAMLASVVAAFLYLRLIVVMYMGADQTMAGVGPETTLAEAGTEGGGVGGGVGVATATLTRVEIPIAAAVATICTSSASSPAAITTKKAVITHT